MKQLFETLNQLNYCVAKWFTVSKSLNRIVYRESFDSDRDFGAGLRIILFRSELRNGFMNHFI